MITTSGVDFGRPLYWAIVFQQQGTLTDFWLLKTNPFCFDATPTTTFGYGCCLESYIWSGHHTRVQPHYLLMPAGGDTQRQYFRPIRPIQAKLMHLGFNSVLVVFGLLCATLLSV